jgi:hypothetical protein
MIDRCNNPNMEHYSDYGGRGITVCERWTGPDGFANFVADMGPRPPGHTIERVNNDGNYEPRNCIWLLAKLQPRNTRRTKLTAEKAERIRNDPRRHREIAQEYEISQAYVSDIKSGKKWR